MTIPFRLYKENEPNTHLEKLFLSEAVKHNLKELQGHRSVGGIRAAIFNALSYEEIVALVEFMNLFKEQHQENQSNGAKITFS